MAPKWKRMCNSVGHMNNSKFGSWGKWVSTHPFLRRETSHGKAIHPKLPIDVQLKWSVIVTSIGHQSNQGVRSEFWITWFDWHRPIIEDNNVSLVHSIRSAWPLWSLDQKNESYGLWNSGHCRGIFLGEKHLECYLDTGMWWDLFVVFFVVQERNRRQNFRYIRDERSNFDDDSPRLLKTFSSSRRRW